MRKFIAIKEKVSLYSNQITFNYNQKCHPLHPRDTWYKQFPPKKKKKKKKRREKERKVVEKRRRRKGMERVCAEGKGKGRMRGGKKEERKKKERKEEKKREE